MVRDKTIIGRCAFTMIELIFAIVIIAITVISLPMMTQATSRGVEGGLVQEAIFAASAELMGATSFYWDTNSLIDVNLSSMSRVIDLEVDCNAEKRRPGHIAQPLHRRCLDSSALGTADSSGGEFLGLDHAEHPSEATFLEDGTGAISIGSAAGYKNDYNSSLDVVRNVFFQEGLGADQNLKSLTVTIEDSTTGDDITVLRTYSANIGEIDFFKRSF